jgi:hypothetical protein
MSPRRRRIVVAVLAGATAFALRARIARALTAATGTAMVTVRPDERRPE